MNCKSIPLWLAILININVIVGGAFFIGAPKIAEIAGSYAPFAWIIGGLLFYPIVSVLVSLAGQYPFAGGIYVYAQRNFGNLVGLLCGYTYFFGTAAGNAAVLHMFSDGVLRIISDAFGVSGFGSKLVLGFDSLFLLGFFLVSMFGVDILAKAQIVLTIFKSIPMLLIILSIPLFSNFSQFLSLKADSSWFSASLPVIIFAYLGFECCCAMAHKIEGGEKNTGRAIFYSFFLIMFLYAVMQYGLLASLGNRSFSPEAFSGIADLFFNPGLALSSTKFLINFAIVLSYLGGAYSMFYSNNWNLYAMSYDLSPQENKINLLTRFNECGEPYGSSLVQTASMFAMLLVFSQWSMITLADLGLVVAYLFCVLAFLSSSLAKTLYYQLIGALAFVSCLIFSFFLIADSSWKVVGVCALFVLAFCLKYFFDNPKIKSSK